MKIFIDFDDVLFNTGKFREDYKKIFWKNNISKEIFEKYYYDYPLKQKNGHLKKYDAWEHIKKIKNSEKIDVNNLKKEIISFLDKSEKYVFSDVADFMDSFGKSNLYLVSYAVTDFQKLKIKNSKIKKYFEKIIITDSMKSVPIKKIIKEGVEEAFFLDDRVEQIGDVKREIPEIKTIFVHRKEGRYKDRKNKYCDFECSNLKQAQKIIKSWKKQNGKSKYREK